MKDFGTYMYKYFFLLLLVEHIKVVWKKSEILSVHYTLVCNFRELNASLLLKSIV